jgi:hypothetical protein
MMLTSVIVLGMVAALAAAACVVVRVRRPREEPLVVFRCPACGQKLRSPASKAGRPGMCPRCRERWTMPAVSQDVSPVSVCGAYRIGRAPMASR